MKHFFTRVILSRIPSKLKKYATIKSEDSYQNLLHRTFQQTVGSPRWATKKEVKQEDSDDEDINESMVLEICSLTC